MTSDGPIVGRWTRPEFCHKLDYHWNDNTDSTLLGWEEVRAKLREFSERHCTYVVPGSEVATYATLLTAKTKTDFKTFLDEALKRRLLVPPQW